MVQSSFYQKCKNQCWKHLFKLLKKHYHKIFDKNSVNVSWSCMDNMTKKKKSSQQLCCFGKRSDKLKSSKLSTPWQHHNNCPLDNKCLTSKIAYSAEIITYNQQPPNVYLGISETGLKILTSAKWKKMQNSPSTFGN